MASQQKSTNLTEEFASDFQDWYEGKKQLTLPEAVELTRECVERLVDRTKATETQRKRAETIIWRFLSTVCQPFFCNGIGYLLPTFSVARIEAGVPFAITSDDVHFSFLISYLGVHAGAPMHKRIGAHLHNMCAQFGTKAQTRLAFHFEPRTFTAYAARDKGYLIKVTRCGLEEVPNGADGQLFLFPENFQPLLSKPLHEVGVEIDTDADFPKSDRITRSLVPDGHLVKHLFGGTSFAIRSMNENQVRKLILSYVLFLMMPGVVAERAMLQCLGPTGSGKTFLLELLGRLLTGEKFAVRPMPTDLREFENQLINEYLIVYDNVSKVPREIRDRFCQAVTGMEIVRRILFTTAAEARFASRSTIALSAITPPLPELEHQNRTITINFKEREEQGFVAKEELFKVVDRNRDDIMLNLLRRMTLVIEALEAQRDYVPKVNVRLASIATFILRVARHERWEEAAWKLLSAWGEEQTGYALMEDDVSTAITRWMGREDWQPGVELTATMLNERLLAQMRVGNENLNWHGNPLVLAKMISANLKVYASRFGLERGDCKLRTSRGGYSYRFKPSPGLLVEIKNDAENLAPYQENSLF